MPHFRSLSTASSNSIVNKGPDKIMENEFKKLVGGGYTSYKSIFGFGGLELLVDNPRILQELVQDFLNS